MTRFTPISISSRPVRATIALAATAMLAACGGGSADAEGPVATTAAAAAATSAAPAPAVASWPAEVAAVSPINAPVIADQGAIAPEAMDAEAQDQLRAEAADAKPVTDAGTDAPKPVRVDTTAPAAQTAAPVAAASPNAAGSATRSGGRSVPLPTVSSTSPAPAPAPAPAPSPAPAPAVSSPTTAVTSATGTTSTSSTPSSAQALLPVSSSDIRLQVSADPLFSSYKWQWGVECAGQIQGAVNIAETGLQGFDLGAGLGTQRFGKVADPEDASRRVLMFRPNAGDPWIYGGPRCEMTFSPNFAGKLPVRQDVWFAFGMRFQDWSSSTDEQVLMQWHWSNGSIPVGPFLALAMKGGRLQIDSKANAAYPPSPSTTTSTVHWTGDAPANSWSYFVVKARISPNPADAPYLQVWRDGAQIVNHQGPFGYTYPEVTPYVKIGHYQWIASYNTWSSTARTKTVLVRTPALINDTTGKYTEADIRGHVRAR